LQVDLYIYLSVKISTYILDLNVIIYGFDYCTTNFLVFSHVTNCNQTFNTRYDHIKLPALLDCLTLHITKLLTEKFNKI